MLPNRVELLLALMAAWRIGAAATPSTRCSPRTRPATSSTTPVPCCWSPPTAERRSLCPAGGARDRAARIAARPHDRARRPRVADLRRAAPPGVPKVCGSITRTSPRWPGRSPRRCASGADDPACWCCRCSTSTRSASAASRRCRPVGRSPSSAGSRRTRSLGPSKGYRPTYFSAVPTIYARLAELPEDAGPDTSSVRFAVCGAAPVSGNCSQRCESRFGFALDRGVRADRGHLRVDASTRSAACASPAPWASRCRAEGRDHRAGRLVRFRRRTRRGRGSRARTSCAATSTARRRPPRRSSTAGCTPVTSA